MKKLKCPLCGGEMKHRKTESIDTYKPPSERQEEYTHAWICEQSCPCVVFEFFNDRDIDNLKKIIK